MAVDQTLNIDDQVTVVLDKAIVQLTDNATSSTVTYDSSIDPEVTLNPSDLVISTTFGTSVSMSGVISLYFQKNTDNCVKSVSFTPQWSLCLSSGLGVGEVFLEEFGGEALISIGLTNDCITAIT